MEVIVIGGGLAGSAVALELRRRGAHVNVVDREGPGAAATGAAAGMLAPLYEGSKDLSVLSLMCQARDEAGAFFQSLEALSGYPLHVRFPGMLVVNRSDEDHQAGLEQVSRQRSMGEPAEILTPREAASLEPNLSREVASLLWLPREGQIDAQGLVTAIPLALDASGVRTLSGPRVARILERQGQAAGVELDDGRTLGGDAVILAAGAWSGQLQGLPRHLPVRPVRGQLLRFDPGRQGVGRLVGDRSGHYLVPAADGTVLAGSTMDEVGFDRSITDDGERSIHEAVSTLLPGLRNRSPRERWADLRPMTPDGLPILGPDPELEGLFYATGYGRNGILLSGLAASLLADALLEGSTGSLPDLFRPDRFSDGTPNAHASARGRS